MNINTRQLTQHFKDGTSTKQRTRLRLRGHEDKGRCCVVRHIKGDVVSSVR